MNDTTENPHHLPDVKGLSLEQPEYFTFLFEQLIAKQGEKDDPLEQMITTERERESALFEGSALQESWNWRNVAMGRDLAKALLNEKGELEREKVLHAISILQKNLYSLGPKRYLDHQRHEYLLNTLRKLAEDPSLQVALKKIHAPHRNPIAEKLVRESLQLPSNEPVTDLLTKQSALSALFTYLRQNVGSCFATAPAILLQQEQPLQVLQDLYQLIATGRLTRMVEGNEIAVPLSPSRGLGELLKPISPFTLGPHPLSALSASPGLIAAFQATEIVPPKYSIQKWLEKKLRSLSFFDKEASLRTSFTAHQLIWEILLEHFSLTDEDIEHFKNTASLIQESSHYHVLTSKKKTKREMTQAFLVAYRKAKEAFCSLTDHALLKAWEFTLASLSEFKGQFATWNLYSALGFSTEESYGLGACFVEVLQAKLDEIRQEIEDYQKRCDIVYAQLTSLQGRINRAEADRTWLLAEFKTHQFEYHRLLNERDLLIQKGEEISKILPVLFAFYEKKFKEFFQEVYDAEMQDVQASPYDDSPAGFRLLYKHGRSQTSLWTLIYTPEEFIDALSSFFLLTEVDLQHLPEIENLKPEAHAIVTAILIQIKKKDFLDAAFKRLARAYHEPLPKDPLEHLEQVQRKPWSYVSGGTMETLVSCYFGLSHKPDEKSRWVESPEELLIFYLDTLKELPHATQEKFRRNSEDSLLAFSPTHAFLLKPGLPAFREGWDNKAFTYTWIKDQWINPATNFWMKLLLDPLQQEKLTERIAELFPKSLRSLFLHLCQPSPLPLTTTEFKHHLLSSLGNQKWWKQENVVDVFSSELDAFFQLSLPLIPVSQLSENLNQLFDTFDLEKPFRERLRNLVPDCSERIKIYPFLSAKEFRQIAQELLLWANRSTRTALPLHEELKKNLWQLELSAPTPVIFADTNWVNQNFAFLVNPGSLQLDLWRFEERGWEGKPMNVWKKYLNGEEKKEWGLYINPFQVILNRS